MRQIQFIADDYRYGDALIVKMANAMQSGKKPEALRNKQKSCGVFFGCQIFQWRLLALEPTTSCV